MTPEEQRRLAMVEAGLAAASANIRNLSEGLKSANEKLDQLVAAANMGKGAWWLVLRLGGLVAGLAILIGAASNILGLHK